MFSIKINKGKFTEYELRDNAANSYIKVIPELGGIITDFNINGEDIFYIDRQVLETSDFPSAGGNPFMFPVCGRLTDGHYSVNGNNYTMPLHGFARTSQWRLKDTKEGDIGEIALELSWDDETMDVYPFKFKVVLRYVLEGSALTIHQEYFNEDDVQMPFYTGFHPYFAVGGKERLVFDINSDKYIDYNEGCIKEYKGEINFNAPVDFVFSLNDRKGSAYSMEDPEKGRKLLIETTEEFKYMVMWTLEGSSFICVEPWIAAPDAMNTEEDLYRLAPGKSLMTWVRYTSKPI